MNENNGNNQAPSRFVSHGSSLAIPLAIVVGFGMIALSIYFGGDRSTNIESNTNNTGNHSIDVSNINPVTEDDHIRGNPNARVMVVEYSDFDCPFCKSFHTTMQKIMDEYGPTGDVAWVYRHMPLTSLHPSAAYLAQASECVAEFGGDEAFWDFADMIFGERGANEPTNIARLPEFAEAAGVSKSDYEACIDSEKHREKIEADLANAIAVGAEGTPYSVIIVGDQLMTINGAQPYDQVKLLIDGLTQ